MGSQVWAWSNREFVWQMGFSTAFLWPLLTKRFFVYFHAVKMLKNDSFDRISHDNLIKWLKTPKLQYSIWTLITLCSLWWMNLFIGRLSLIYCDVKMFIIYRRNDVMQSHLHFQCKLSVPLDPPNGSSV